MAEAIPLQGDRSARNALNYPSLHANDTDVTDTSIHHTIGSGSAQVASGSHVHTLGSITSGSAESGQVLTADGSGSTVWQTPTANFLSNVHVPSPTAGDVLTWSESSGSWIAYTPADWRITLTQDNTSNDSDKTFVAPAFIDWQILWIWVEYTSSAVVGTRQLELQVQDSDDTVLMQMQTGVTQAESTTVKYLFGLSVPDMTVLRDSNYLTTPLPAGTLITNGQKIRIWDNNAVDASADDMIVRMQYAYRSLTVLIYYILPINNAANGQTSTSVTLTAY